MPAGSSNEESALKLPGDARIEAALQSYGEYRDDRSPAIGDG
jgi:hypothetical protein